MNPREITFHKMHGAGNDYVFIDCFEQCPEFARMQTPAIAEIARRISDRHYGVGSDGLILIMPSQSADCRMRMFNSDGSEAETCGNGVRCVAKYAYESGIAPKEEIAVETGAGILTLKVFAEDGKVGRVRVNMGRPRLAPADVPVSVAGESLASPPVGLPTKSKAVIAHPLRVEGREFAITCISMGNPHCVIFVDGVEDFPIEKFGPLIENNEIFPHRANVEFVTVRARGEVVQRTWERGAGETLACGTGASAVCVAGVLNGLTERKILAHLSGGDLELEWAESGEVYMTGPAQYVFAGKWRYRPTNEDKQ